MTERFVKHDTFVIEKNFEASPAQVFAAWSDPSLKEKWFAEADEFDFQVGGWEINHGGPPGGKIFTFRALYQEIVQDERIIYSYTMDLEDIRISASVTTVEFKSTGSGTQLIFTEHGAFLDGHDNVVDRQHGTSNMLDKLGKELQEVADSDREIVNTRTFNASCVQMFEAFNDPEYLVHWWGPKGFTNTFHEFDMRPDGVWHFTMHGPNGINYENKIVFVEVVKSRIVLRHLEPNHEYLLTVTFEENFGMTNMTWRMLFESADECERVGSFCKMANEENFDRLEEQLKIIVGQT